MSNYSFVTARNPKIDLKKELLGVYPNTHFNDVLYYEPNKKVIVGLIGLDKNLPVLQDILSFNKVKDFLGELKENSRILFDLNKNSILVNKVEKPFSKEVKELIDKVLIKFKNYGGYLNKNGEHVIDLMSPPIGPHFAVNLLLGDRSKLSEPLLTTPKAVVDAFGGGSFRGPAANQVLATRWDMDPAENGHPANRQFYILEEGKQVFYSHNIHENVVSATCTHKVNHSVIEYVLTNGLKITRTIYIRPQISEDEPIALERQIVEISNNSHEKHKISIVFTGMFGSANPGCQMVDVIYQSVINQTGILYKDNKMVAISPSYYPKYAQEYVRFASLGEEGFDEFSYDISNFLGHGSLEHPENLANLGNELKFKGPSFYALKKNVELSPKESKTVISSVGLVDNKHDLASSVDLILNADWKKELTSLKNSFKRYSSYLQVSTGDLDFDNYVNKNLPFQILYQTYVSRGFAQTQKGYREIGFREIQDLYASMNYFIHNKQKKLVQNLLSKWISNVYEFGYSNHNFYFEGKEPGMCSDDSLWLVDAIYRYIKETNDYSFLRKKFIIAGSNKTRSLYNTLKSIIRYSGEISIGKHGLPLLDKADWNDCLKIDDDCLDGPSKEKLYKLQLRKKHQSFGVPFESNLSESVMNAFLLDIAIKDMIVFSKELKDNEYLNHLNELKNKLEENIQKHAYVDGYFARVLINKEDSKYKFVGTPNDALSITSDFKGSIYLNSFSWSLLSGVASESQIKEMLPLVDKYLKTEAGYKLCTPHDLTLCGSKEAATEQYFLGDRENGGVFKHATMMFVVACLKASKVVKDEALKATLESDAKYMLDIVYPFNVMKNIKKIRGNPRFCTQYVNSQTGEHIGPILSGTSTWLLLALKEIF